MAALIKSIFVIYVLFCVASTANAQTVEELNPSHKADESQGLYVALRGYGAIEDENNLIFDNSYEVAGALGYRYKRNWRVELEYAYRHSDIIGLNGSENAKGETSNQSVGVHIFHDFRNGRKLRPFLGVGAGVLNRTVTLNGTADIDPTFEIIVDDQYEDFYANAFAGASYHITRDFRLAVGFEYVTGRDRNIRANFRELPGIHRSYNFFVGGRWFFPD